MSSYNVDPDIILGNIIIELFNRNIYKITRDQIAFIEKIIDEEFKKNGNYYSNKSCIQYLQEFCNHYAWLIEYSVARREIFIKYDTYEDRNLFNRYFRIGCYKDIINIISKAVDIICGTNIDTQWLYDIIKSQMDSSNISSKKSIMNKYKTLITKLEKEYKEDLEQWLTEEDYIRIKGSMDKWPQYKKDYVNATRPSYVKPI